LTRLRSLLRQLDIQSLPALLYGKGKSSPVELLAVDSIGELAALYALADVAFVGGSLVPRGGHNIIEPAQHGVAIVTGNHTENFRDIVALFQKPGRRAHRRHGGVTPDSDASCSPTTPNGARSARRAEETMRSQMGATLRTLEGLKTLMADGRDPLPVSAQAAHTD